jgi:hypothetical protein
LSNDVLGSGHINAFAIVIAIFRVPRWIYDSGLIGRSVRGCPGQEGWKKIYSEKISGEILPERHRRRHCNSFHTDLLIV